MQLPLTVSDMPSDKYHSTTGISKSGLALIKKAPALYAEKYIYGEQDGPKKHFEVGSALHIRVLEPEHFTSRVVAGLDLQRRSNADKAAHAVHAERHKNKLIIDPSDYRVLEEMAASAYAHPEAAKWLNFPGRCEESFFWKDPITGELCKVRTDKRIPEEKVIIDLKSCREGKASPDQFARECFNLTYFIQAAWYLDGASIVTGQRYDRFIFIVIEKTSPYLVGVYELDPDAIELGRKEYSRLLRLYSECRKNNQWPGYSESLVTLSLPSYGVKQTEDLLDV